MKRPSGLHPWADEILRKLAGLPASKEIVLGGYFALQHFLDFRPTNDIDAWWRDRANPQTLEAIRSVMGEFAERHGCALTERQFGETYSFELAEGGKKVYSFQIAVRSCELEPPLASLWPPIMIETLRDNVGAKMNALVDRGAPRDFLDIEQVVASGLLNTEECWILWSEKNDKVPIQPAKQKVMFHLTALEARRPPESITDTQLREETVGRRVWFKSKFLGN